jgi:hypothetical protein
MSEPLFEPNENLSKREQMEQLLNFAEENKLHFVHIISVADSEQTQSLVHMESNIKTILHIVTALDEILAALKEDTVKRAMGHLFGKKERASND